MISQADSTGLANCLQTTNSGRRSNQVRYTSPAAPPRRHYRAAQHENTTTHSADPILELDAGERMLKQSYIDLDQFFTMETRLLSSFCDNTKRLMPRVVASLQRSLTNFVQGRVPLNWGSSIKSAVSDR